VTPSSVCTEASRLAAFRTGTKESTVKRNSACSNCVKNLLSFHSLDSSISASYSPTTVPGSIALYRLFLALGVSAYRLGLRFLAEVFPSASDLHLSYSTIAGKSLGIRFLETV